MRRIPLLELLVLGILALAVSRYFVTVRVGRAAAANERACRALLEGLGPGGGLPAALEPVEGGARRHGGYLFAAYEPGDDGPVLVPLDQGPPPPLLLAWPEEVGETGHRAFARLRSGEVLATENLRPRLSGLPPPPCPWERLRFALPLESDESAAPPPPPGWRDVRFDGK
jgi:hypothetical protein